MPHSRSLTTCSDLKFFGLSLNSVWVLEWVWAEKEKMRGQGRNSDGSLLFPFPSSCLSSCCCTMAYA